MRQVGVVLGLVVAGAMSLGVAAAPSAEGSDRVDSPDAGALLDAPASVERQGPAPNPQGDRPLLDEVLQGRPASRSVEGSLGEYAQSLLERLAGAVRLRFFDSAWFALVIRSIPCTTCSKVLKISVYERPADETGESRS